LNNPLHSITYNISFWVSAEVDLIDLNEFHVILGNFALRDDPRIRFWQDELPLLAPWYPPRRIPASPAGGGGEVSLLIIRFIPDCRQAGLPRRQAGTGKVSGFLK
ncbi:hypothetical protein CO181_03285, partial [candidate division WWE3 bacterium CG_4_9_14_3_um_filter_43_9]